MKYTYEETTNIYGQTVIIRSDTANIPADLSNADYQAYLRWLENPDAEEFTGGTLS